MIPPSVKIFLAIQPADMRRSFDGLSGMVKDIVRKNPMSGNLFVFRNRKGNRVKILFWDRTGFCLWYKRLEKGVFRFPEDDKKRSVEIDPEMLRLVLDGINLFHTRDRSM